MNATSPRYDRWKAPAEDGQVLIWPQAGQILRDTLENQRLFSQAHSVLLQNTPLPEIRRHFRKRLTTSGDQPIIATGHQTELHHPGVWIKNVVIDAMAAKLGAAIHFAVDTDEPKHLTLRWPGGAVPLVEEMSGARWSGLLKSPTPPQLDRVEQAIAEAERHWSFRPFLREFLSHLRQSAFVSSDLPSALSSALLLMDSNDLGVSYQRQLVSLLCEWDPYLLFAYHVLAHAEAFAADYNASLAEYRRENRIRAAGRPMPNLEISDSGIEVPFWLDDLSTGQRVRAGVSHDKDGFILRAAGDAFVGEANREGWVAAQDLKAWLRQHNLQLAPRALTLTAVLRLLAADQFVHGIGGGQYDQVLDKLIARHLGMEPPRFAVATATLYFPEAAGKSRACLPCIRQEGHRLRHSVLGEKKRELVEAIASAPRGSAERAALFSRMHQQLDAAANDPRIRQWEREYEQALGLAREEHVLFDRELFYALQPMERLMTLIADVGNRMAPA